MIRNQIFLFLLISTIACQDKKVDDAQMVKDIAHKVEALGEEAAQKPNYAELIKGTWRTSESRGGSDSFLSFDGEKAYTDANEEGTEYEIEGDKLIYRVLGGGEPAEYKILELTDKKLTYQIDKDRKETWIKVDKIQKKMADEGSQKSMIDVKLLVGTWVNETETDEFSKQRVYKSNGKMDMTPFNDFAKYQVKGNKIKYTNIINNGSPYEDVITSLTAKELVINGKFKFKRTK
jgi:hypothetical protein